MNLLASFSQSGQNCPRRNRPTLGVCLPLAFLTGTGRFGGMDMLGSPNSPDSLPSLLLLLLRLLPSSSPLLLLLPSLSPAVLLPEAAELNTVLVGAILTLVESRCWVFADSSSSSESVVDCSESEPDSESVSLPERSPHSPPSEGSASTSASSACACSVHAWRETNHQQQQHNNTRQQHKQTQSSRCVRWATCHRQQLPANAPHASLQDTDKPHRRPCPIHTATNTQLTW